MLLRTLCVSASLKKVLNNELIYTTYEIMKKEILFVLLKDFAD